jgi:aspartate-semialdehyde dehydrogenase
VVAGVNDPALRGGNVIVSPHPAVVLLSHLLHPLASLDPQQAAATVLLPASMEGDPGIEELAEQARNIFTMSGRKPSPVFGAQLTFNVLPTAIPVDPLAAELRAVLGRPVALQILRAGVFHSLAVSLHVRLAGNPNGQALRKALGSNPHLEFTDVPKHLGPIEAAASEKVLYGTVRKDPDGGFWLWAVMDNLTRGGALNAIEIAEAV